MNRMPPPQQPLQRAPTLSSKPGQAYQPPQPNLLSKPKPNLPQQQQVQQQSQSSVYCTKCKGICDTSGYISLRDGSVFHQQCFTCQICQTELPLKHVLKNGKYYHIECYQNAKANAPKCTRCQQTMLNEIGILLRNQLHFHHQCFTCDKCQQPLTSNCLITSEGFMHQGCVSCIHCQESLLNLPFEQQADGNYACKFCLQKKNSSISISVTGSVQGSPLHTPPRSQVASKMPSTNDLSLPGVSKAPSNGSLQQPKALLGKPLSQSFPKPKSTNSLTGNQSVSNSMDQLNQSVGSALSKAPPPPPPVSGAPPPPMTSPPPPPVTSPKPFAAAPPAAPKMPTGISTPPPAPKLPTGSAPPPPPAPTTGPRSAANSAPAPPAPPPAAPKLSTGVAKPPAAPKLPTGSAPPPPPAPGPATLPRQATGSAPAPPPAPGPATLPRQATGSAPAPPPAPGPATLPRQATGSAPAPPPAPKLPSGGAAPPPPPPPGPKSAPAPNQDLKIKTDVKPLGGRQDLLQQIRSASVKSLNHVETKDVTTPSFLRKDSTQSTKYNKSTNNTSYSVMRTASTGGTSDLNASLSKALEKMKVKAKGQEEEQEVVEEAEYLSDHLSKRREYMETKIAQEDW